MQHVVEKEKHKDHYHTTVQPLTDNEVKPEVHTHKQAPTQHREFEHDDKAKTQHKLAADKAHFKDTTTYGAAIETKSQAPTVTGEHVHHHIHETVQPVIHKGKSDSCPPLTMLTTSSETVQPSVTHTTIPIKETHHEAAEHHASTIAQPMSIDEFKKDHTLAGTSAAHKTKYEGTPKGEAD